MVQIRGAKVIEDKRHLFVHYDNFDTNISVTLWVYTSEKHAVFDPLKISSLQRKQHWLWERANTGHTGKY